MKSKNSSRSGTGDHDDTCSVCKGLGSFNWCPFYMKSLCYGPFNMGHNGDISLALKLYGTFKRNWFNGWCYQRSKL